MSSSSMRQRRVERRIRNRKWEIETRARYVEALEAIAEERVPDVGTSQDRRVTAFAQAALEGGDG